MEDITVGQIGIGVTFLVGLITGIGYLTALIKKSIKSVLQEELKPLNDKIDEMQKELKKTDMEATKNFLVSFLANAEYNPVNEIELQRFYEEYEHYTKMGGNTYIKDKVEKLKEKNIL